MIKYLSLFQSSSYDSECHCLLSINCYYSGNDHVKIRVAELWCGIRADSTQSTTKHTRRCSFDTFSKDDSTRATWARRCSCPMRFARSGRSPNYAKVSNERLQIPHADERQSDWHDLVRCSGGRAPKCESIQGDHPRQGRVEGWKGNEYVEIIQFRRINPVQNAQSCLSWQSLIFWTM